jgi:hypothetical protein
VLYHCSALGPGFKFIILQFPPVTLSVSLVLWEEEGSLAFS